MMGIEIREFAPLPREVSLEDLVPTGCFYGDLEKRPDLSFVREMVAPLYAGGGRASVDPVVFFKLQLVMFFKEMVQRRKEAGLWRGGRSRTSTRRRWTPTPLSTRRSAPLRRTAAPGRPLRRRRARRLHRSRRGFLPAVHDEGLKTENAATDDRIARNGRQGREVKGVRYQRAAAFLVSKTDPDSSPMKRRDSKGSHLGYHAHYVVDGGRARIILNALVTPFGVTENAPMLDLLWRSVFRWGPRPGHRRHRPRYDRGHHRLRARLRSRAGPLPVPGRGGPAASDDQRSAPPRRPRSGCRNPRAVRAEGEMHGQRDGSAGAAMLRRALRRSGDILSRHLPLREGAAQEAGVCGAVVRRGGEGSARHEEVQARTPGEGERRGPDDSVGPERKAFDGLRSSGTQEVGAGRRPRLPRRPTLRSTHRGSSVSWWPKPRGRRVSRLPGRLRPLLRDMTGSASSNAPASAPSERVRAGGATRPG